MAILRGLPKLIERGPATSNVRVLGVPQAIAKLEAVKNYARLELGYTAFATAAIVETKAKEYVPVITGNLRSGIHTNHVGPYAYEVTASSLAGDVAEKNTKEYAGFVEFGTSKMAPRLFLTRAYRDGYPYAVGRLKALAARIETM